MLFKKYLRFLRVKKAGVKYSLNFNKLLTHNYASVCELIET
jgi:hypothetical protein